MINWHYELFFRYMFENRIDKVLIYLSPGVAQKMSMYFWEFTKSKGIMVQCIPPNLYKNLIHDGLGIFNKFNQVVQKVIWKW